MYISRVEFTQDNLPAQEPVPGITVEYAPAESGDRDAEQSRLNTVIAGLIVAFDAALRNDPSSLAMEQEANQIVDTAMGHTSAGLELIRPDLRFETKQLPELLGYSAKVASHLGSPYGKYDIMHSHSGEIVSGRNLIGDAVVSTQFDYESPQNRSGMGAGGSHWYKRSLSVVASDKDRLTADVRSGSHPSVAASTLGAVLENPALHRFLGSDPGVRLSDAQPTVLRTAKYQALEQRTGEALPNIIPMRGISELLQRQAGVSQDTLEYIPLAIREYSSLGEVSAYTALVDQKAGIGVKIAADASPAHWESKLGMTLDSDTEELKIAPKDGGSASRLSSLNVKVLPVMFNGEYWSEVEHPEINVFQRPRWIERANEVNLVVDGIRERLLNA